MSSDAPPAPSENPQTSLDLADEQVHWDLGESQSYGAVAALLS